MGKVLGDNAAAWLLLLGDIITITVDILGIVASIIFIVTSSTGNLDFSSTKFGVVEEEGSLGSGFLLKGHSGTLGLAGGSNLEVGNLAAVRN